MAEMVLTTSPPRQEDRQDAHHLQHQQQAVDLILRPVLAGIGTVARHLNAGHGVTGGLNDAIARQGCHFQNMLAIVFVRRS